MADIAARPSALDAHAPPRPKKPAGGLCSATPFRSWWCSGCGSWWRGSACFPPKLFPSLVEGRGRVRPLTANGILPHHVLDTVLRLLSGFVLAAVVGVALGILMGRSRRVEDIALPLVSIGAPIPGLAYAPLFLFWFGLGNKSAVLLVAFVSAFPIIFNTWTGVKAVKEIWVRSAQAMGADDRRLFVKVILPGALPYILTGCGSGSHRPGAFWSASRCWPRCRGARLDDLRRARIPHNTDVMLAGVVVIGVIGWRWRSSCSRSSSNTP